MPSLTNGSQKQSTQINTHGTHNTHTPTHNTEEETNGTGSPPVQTSKN
jgi:hypothetical protein